MENNMIAFPFMVVVILSTAIISSIITTSLPTLIQRWHVFKSRIKRKKNTNPYPTMMDKIDDLQTQVDNLAERLATRDTNRKNNIRRATREYLEELKNG